LALILARPGVGKTALLVGIGIDALLAGQRVLYISFDRTVEKVNDWFDEILTEMLQREKKSEHLSAIQLEIQRRRHIQTYVDHSFSVDRLRQGVDVLARAMEFKPDVIVIDRTEQENFDKETVSVLKEMAAGLDAELWMAYQTHRTGPQGEPGHLPPPADQLEDLVDLAIRLDPQGSKVRLHVVVDRDKIVDKDLNILLDPRTLLLTSGFSPGH
jgi:KaiC/GvpD/RAD55 family RecA-like ATPase